MDAQKTDEMVFTLGYEGRSLEDYLNRLVKNNVQILFDVRKNAISRKYGFSKSRLEKSVNNLNIQYIHLPELGIDSSQRKSLNTQDDYDALLANYGNLILPNHLDSVEKIYRLIKINKRIAITCFEAMFYQCHRSVIAKILSTNYGFQVKHI
ncbi:DUF488 domain-containing protein [Candidatus Magnetomonas plexicatena]|nr:DUF488 domain-containing protein [Nitrospirales bacterium LBB_01]